MGSILGKRKLRVPAADVDDVQTIFRRHFEAQFKPLPPIQRPNRTAVEANDEDDTESDSKVESEWGGLSDGDEGDTVEIIDHSTPLTAPIPELTKRERRAYMSSRPPSATSPPPSSHLIDLTAAASDEDPDDESAPSLLANDLALRRLLAESHLLSSLAPHNALSSSSSSAAAAAAHRDTTGGPQPFKEGRTRLRAADMRLAALGSRESLFAPQRAMPMAHRRGMAKAAAERETTRRREAKEGGIVLERPAAGGGKAGKKARGAADKRDRERRRGRDVFAPDVGRLKGGTELRLSARDVRKIEGPRDVERGRKRKRR